MNNASTADGRGQDRPNDAEPFFPSEGSFNTVVPLSEIGRAPAPAPLAPFDPADVGRPAEAAWAREAHRAGWKKEEEETTLVPARGVRGVRQSWVVTASVIALSVAAGLASGTYLIWSARRAPRAQPPAQVAAEAPTLQPAPDTTHAPAAVQEEANTKVEKVSEAVKDETPREVAKAEKPVEASRAPKESTPSRPTNAPRAERTTRDVSEAREVTPAPTHARTQNAAPSRPRVTAAAKQPPPTSSAARTLPISSPPPSAKSKKVIQWP